MPEVYTSAAGVSAPMPMPRKASLRSSAAARISTSSSATSHQTVPAGSSAACEAVVITATGAASLTMCAISRSRYSTLMGTQITPSFTHAIHRSTIAG